MSRNSISQCQTEHEVLKSKAFVFQPGSDVIILNYFKLAPVHNVTLGYSGKIVFKYGIVSLKISFKHA